MSATCEECGWSYRDDSPTWLENSVACPLYEMHRIVFRIKLILLEIPAGLSKILIRFQPSSKTLLSFANRIADTVIFEISYSGRNNRNEAVAGLGFFQGVMQTLVSRENDSWLELNDKRRWSFSGSPGKQSRFPFRYSNLYYNFWKSVPSNFP